MNAVVTDPPRLFSDDVPSPARIKVPFAEAIVAIGISAGTYCEHWGGIFTPYQVRGSA